MPSSEINQLFNLLDNWRLLPAYQLERRADIFFALYLEHIIQDILKLKVLKIIPEFPMHKKTLDENGTNQSFKMDYLVVCETKVLFIELKTDSSSINEKQHQYLEQAKAATIPKLIDGLLEINKATKQKVKCARLLKQLAEEKIAWLKSENSNWENTGTNQEIEIVYIQPNLEENIKGYSIIPFKKVATSIEQIGSHMALRFAKSLRSWQVSPNDN